MTPKADGTEKTHHGSGEDLRSTRLKRYGDPAERHPCRRESESRFSQARHLKLKDSLDTYKEMNKDQGATGLKFTCTQQDRIQGFRWNKCRLCRLQYTRSCITPPPMILLSSIISNVLDKHKLQRTASTFSTPIHVLWLCDLGSERLTCRWVHLEGTGFEAARIIELHFLAKRFIHIDSHHPGVKKLALWTDLKIIVKKHNSSTFISNVNVCQPAIWSSFGEIQKQPDSHVATAYPFETHESMIELAF